MIEYTITIYYTLIGGKFVVIFALNIVEKMHEKKTQIMKDESEGPSENGKKKISCL